MFCLNCGKRLNKDTKFCFRCGNKVKGEEKRKKSRPFSKLILAFAGRFKNFSKIKFVAVLLIIVLLAGGYYAFSIYKTDKLRDAESQQKVNSQLQETQSILQETQKELNEIKSQVSEQSDKQSDELEETKQELAVLKKNNSELRNLANSQQTTNPPIKTSISVSDFVSKNGKYVVKVFCADASNNVSVGSGVIMGKSGNSATLIMTNNHVIPKTYTTSLDYPCIVAYSGNPTVSLTNFYYAQPVYFSSRATTNTMSLYDFAYLEIRQAISLNNDNIVIIPNASLILAAGGRPTVCKIDDIQVGNKVIIMGYAGVGGNYLTAKEGIISGFDTVYSSTSAKIERGDSGGGAFLPDSGCLIGMPTFSVSGQIESLGRILMLSYISNHIIQLSELGN